MAAFLLGGELVLEMDPGDACLDHRFHQLEGVERAAESGLGIGDHRDEPVGPGLVLGDVDLIGALQRPIDPSHQLRAARGRVETLVGIGLAGVIGVGGDLPAADIDRVQPGPHHLDRLIAGHRAERLDIGTAVERLPQPRGAALGQSIADADRAAQALDSARRIVAAYADEAGGNGTIERLGHATDSRIDPGFITLYIPYYLNNFLISLIKSENS